MFLNLFFVLSLNFKLVFLRIWHIFRPYSSSLPQLLSESSLSFAIQPYAIFPPSRPISITAWLTCQAIQLDKINFPLPAANNCQWLPGWEWNFLSNSPFSAQVVQIDLAWVLCTSEFTCPATLLCPDVFLQSPGSYAPLICLFCNNP